jgi:serine/threonine protein kinase
MRAKLSDFGISRYKLDDETMTAAVGTIRWVAPEVMAGQRYDESVDIYSLGIILSEIDTHKLPFDDLTDESGHERLTDSAIAGLLLSGSLSSSFSESCPSEIRSLASRCTAFVPADRPTGLQVAYELRMMLKNASAWTNSNGTFLSSSSISDDAVVPAAAMTSSNTDAETTSTRDETPASTHVSI